ncbi:hypothetical protein EPD83_018750 [Phycicoccus sp. CMS6Z-2]|nr:hypothetical protein [Phycicoccus flavus]
MILSPARGCCQEVSARLGPFHEDLSSLHQKNVLNVRRWDTLEQLRLTIVTWVERGYHRRRRERALGQLIPIEFETINRATHAGA